MTYVINICYIPLKSLEFKRKKLGIYYSKNYVFPEVSKHNSSVWICRYIRHSVRALPPRVNFTNARK